MGQGATVAATAVVILVLVALGWLLGFRPRGSLDRAVAVAALVHFEPRAGLKDLVIGQDGKSAVGLLHDGRWLLVRWMGDRPALVAVDPAAVRVTGAPTRLVVSQEDLGQQPLRLALDAPAPGWLVSRLN